MIKNIKFTIILVLGLALNGISSTTLASDGGQKTWTERFTRGAKIALATVGILTVSATVPAQAVSNSICHPNEALATCENERFSECPLHQMIVTRPIEFSQSHSSLRPDFFAYQSTKCEDKIPASEARGHFKEAQKNRQEYLKQAYKSYEKATHMHNHYKDYIQSIVQMSQLCPVALDGDMSQECSSHGQALELSRQIIDHHKKAKNLNEYNLPCVNNEERTRFLDIIFCEGEIKREVVDKIADQIRDLQ